MDHNCFPALKNAHFTLLCDSMPPSHTESVETWGTNLLDEKVADLLEQHSETPWGAVGLARGPNQTDHMEQRLQPRLQLWELHGLEGFQVEAEWHQVHVDVLRLHQSWKE